MTVCAELLASAWTTLNTSGFYLGSIWASQGFRLAITFPSDTTGKWVSHRLASCSNPNMDPFLSLLTQVKNQPGFQPGKHSPNSLWACVYQYCFTLSNNGLKHLYSSSLLLRVTILLKLYPISTCKSWLTSSKKPCFWFQHWFLLSLDSRNRNGEAQGIQLIVHLQSCLLLALCLCGGYCWSSLCIFFWKGVMNQITATQGRLCLLRILRCHKNNKTEQTSKKCHDVFTLFLKS